MSPRSTRRTLLVAALVVVACACSERGAGVESVAMAATGTDPAGDGGGQPPETPATVAMVGDSITFMSSEPLQVALAGTGLEVLAIDAQVGRRITVGDGGRPHPGTEIVAYIASSDPPDVWIIALGTNDIGQYGDAGEFAVQVQTLLDLLPATAPLVWVDTWDGDRLDATRLVNDTLRSVLGGRENSVVVDWSSHGDDAGVVADDAVHPTSDGSVVFGQVVAAGVEALLASL
jgi:lysophospholipase L1-like esterase